MTKKVQTETRKGTFPAKNKLFLVCLGIYVVLSVFLFDPKLFVGGDNAVYIILAESLVSGKGYTNLYLPEEPPHTQYPPAFPLLLSVFILLFGTNFMVFKCIVVATGLVSLCFMFRITELLFEKELGLVMLLYVSIPVLYIYGSRILSDIPYLCFSLGALYFFIAARRQRTLFYLLSTVFAVCAFFLRTAGMMLIIAVMLAFIVRKEYKYLGVFVVVFLACYIPWHLRNASIPGGIGYTAQFLAKDPYHPEVGYATVIELISRAWSNLIFYSFKIIPKTLLPVLNADALLAIAGFVFVALLGIGFVHRARVFSVFELYTLLSVLLLLGWPRIWSSERFLLPVLPFVVFYVVVGLRWLADKVRFRPAVAIVVFAVIVFNGFMVIAYGNHVVRNNVRYLKGDKYAGYTMDWKNYFTVIDWIRDNIPRDEVIIARKPEFVYLLSKHKSLTYPFSENHEEVQAAIDKADYIIYDNFYDMQVAQVWLLPVIKDQPERYSIVYRTDEPRFFLLEVKH